MIKCHSDLHCKSETIRYCAYTCTHSSSSCSCHFRKFRVGAIRILNRLEINRNELWTCSCSLFLNRGTVPYKRTLHFDFKGNLFSSAITIMGPFGDNGQETYFGHLLLHSVSLTFNINLLQLLYMAWYCTYLIVSQKSSQLDQNSQWYSSKCPI